MRTAAFLAPAAFLGAVALAALGAASFLAFLGSGFQLGWSFLNLAAAAAALSVYAFFSAAPSFFHASPPALPTSAMPLTVGLALANLGLAHSQKAGGKRDERPLGQDARP